MTDRDFSDKTEREQMIEEYFKQMNPHIRKSLDHQQSNELSRFLNRILPQRGRYIIDIRVTFWFFKTWYLVINFGLDKRDTKRLKKRDAVHTLLSIIINTLFIIVVSGLVFIIVFYILYLLKSIAGINIFPDRHLSDFFNKGVLLWNFIITKFRIFQDCV